MNGNPTDPIVALVEQTEGQAIGVLRIERTNTEARRALRANLLDALTAAKRAQRLAELMERLDREVRP